MKWLQVADADGRIRLGFLEGTQAHILREPHHHIWTTLDLLRAIDESHLDVVDWLGTARAANLFESVDWATLDSSGQHGSFSLRYPVTPPEVWGCGVTYRRSAD